MSGDPRWMRRAVELSRRGYPAPNPHVGCVLVRDGRIVGEGYHARAGGPHAEAVALQKAGAFAEGAEAYVTLEPCAHFGKTPPCADALIAAGVAAVHVAVVDPNPKAAGGTHRLQKAGVPVTLGLLAEEARGANLPWLVAMERRRPYVVAKAAASLDGRIALPNGKSQWITGPEARRAAHRLRAECGAVLVGRATVESDDPSLEARFLGAPKIVRVVLDPQGTLGAHFRVFDGSCPTIRAVRTAQREGDLEVAVRDGTFDLPALLSDLFARGVTGLLVEGGAVTLASFAVAGLIDRLELFIGAKTLGDGPAWLRHFGLEDVNQAPQWRIERFRRVGEDLQITAMPRGADGR